MRFPVIPVPLVGDSPIFNYLLTCHWKKQTHKAWSVIQSSHTKFHGIEPDNKESELQKVFPSRSLSWSRETVLQVTCLMAYLDLRRINLLHVVIDCCCLIRTNIISCFPRKVDYNTFFPFPGEYWPTSELNLQTNLGDNTSFCKTVPPFHRIANKNKFWESTFGNLTWIWYFSSSRQGKSSVLSS